MDEGYDALYGCNVDSKQTRLVVESSFDEAKADTLIHTLERCNRMGVRIVAYTSPKYSTSNSQTTLQSQKLLEIFNNNGVQFLEYKHEPDLMKPEYFYDNVHLNYEGSVAFTSKLAHDILHPVKN